MNIWLNNARIRNLKVLLRQGVGGLQLGQSEGVYVGRRVYVGGWSTLGGGSMLGVGT